MKVYVGAVAAIVWFVGCGSDSARDDRAVTQPGSSAPVVTAEPSTAESCVARTTTADAEACLLAAGAALETELQSTLLELEQRSPSPDGVRRSQDAWLDYVRFECELEAAAFEGGSQARVQHALCTARVTGARLADVRNALSLLPSR